MNDGGMTLNGDLKMSKQKPVTTIADNRLLKLLQTSEHDGAVYEELKEYLRHLIVNWEMDWAKEEIREALEAWANE